MRAYRWVALAVLTALIVAACGSSHKPQKPSDVQAASKVVKQWLTAVAVGNGAAACQRMTKSYQARVVSGSPSKCEQALNEVAYTLSTAEKATLSHAKIIKATVKHGQVHIYVKGEKGAAVLTKHAGHWLISGGAAA